MAKSEARTVHPHEPIRELSENLWCVQGDVPGAPIKRRMTIIKLSDGDLVIHNPVLLKKADMKRIEQWGAPRYLVAPNRFHRLDIATFNQRYPDADVVCPAKARSYVEQMAPVDRSYSDVPRDRSVAFEHLEGTDDREGVLSVHSSDGKTLVFNDTLFNMQDQPGFKGFVLKAVGSTGGPKVTNIAKLFVVQNATELRGHLERLAQPDVVRLIPGHGDLIEQDADEVLYRTAVRL